jgi:hypothetical protein
MSVKIARKTDLSSGICPKSSNSLESRAFIESWAGQVVGAAG